MRMSRFFLDPPLGGTKSICGDTFNGKGRQPNMNASAAIKTFHYFNAQTEKSFEA